VIFGGAHDAQTPTGCVVVVADSAAIGLLLRLAGSTPGSPRASTKITGQALTDDQ